MTKMINAEQLLKAVTTLLTHPQGFTAESYGDFMTLIATAVCEFVDSQVETAVKGKDGEWRVGVWGINRGHKEFADPSGGFWRDYEGGGEFYENSEQTIETLLEVPHPLWTHEQLARSQRSDAEDQPPYAKWLANQAGFQLVSVPEGIIPKQDFFSDAMNASSLKMGNALCTIVRPDLISQEVLGIVTETTIIHPDLNRIRPDIVKAFYGVNAMFNWPEWKGRPVTALMWEYMKDFDSESTPVITVESVGGSASAGAGTILTMQMLWNAELIAPNRYRLPCGRAITIEFEIPCDAQQLKAA